MSFSTDVDEATKGIETRGDVRTDIRAAFKTFDTSIQAALANYIGAYGGPAADQEQIWYRERLIDLARHFEAALR